MVSHGIKIMSKVCDEMSLLVGTVFDTSPAGHFQEGLAGTTHIHHVWSCLLLLH